MNKAYYGSKLSNNILRTPEKFLVCKNVPIARTGTQKYIGYEIGLTGADAQNIITVYRTDDEVFSTRTIASFEGKVFTDEHPNDWVTPNTYQTYAKGTITNVRRGTGEQSDLLLADIIVYSQIQIDEIEQKQKREVSCGYECEYVPYKDGYMQKNIIGNHVALVSAGRAGSRVCIKDNANKNLNGGKKHMYKIPRRSNVSDFLKSVGLKHIAMDAEPEDILDAVEELTNEKLEEKLKNEEVKAPVEEKEVIEKTVTDEEFEGVKNSIEEVKKTLTELLDSMTEEEETTEEVFEDDSMEALEEFEKDACKDSEIDEIESVELPPELANKKFEAIEAAKKAEAEKEVDEDIEEIKEEAAEKVSDSAIQLVKALKPIIASIPDKKERKRVSDNLVSVLRQQVKDAKKEGKQKNVYSDLISRKAADNAPVDYGKEIAKKFNPHYKEV